MLETGDVGKNKISSITMICIAAAMLVIIIKDCLLGFLVGSPLWVSIQGNSTVLQYIFLVVKAVTMISILVEVMKNIRSKITDVGLWLIFISVALLI
jgi:hypothetical protein